jgi:hypothetical protein
MESDRHGAGQLVKKVIAESRLMSRRERETAS